MKHISIIFLLLLLCFCTTEKVTRELLTVQEMKAVSDQGKYLKIHLKNGMVYVLHRWDYQKDTSLIQGYGKLLDINREEVESRIDPELNNRKSRKDTAQVHAFEIPVNQIAIMETNYLGKSLGSNLAVITGLSAIMTLICITNPKACFGSCPTFYAWDGERMKLQAEGFSSSVAPFLEKKDLDMLYYTQNMNDELEIKMTNEALETHVIRKADLLVVPKPKEGRVFATKNGEFYSSSHIFTPDSCYEKEGDFTEDIRAMDNLEHMSLADSFDLAKKEIIDLQFDSIPEGKYGLVIGAKQSLLTTFLFYQSLAHMGNSITYWAARFESMKKEKIAGKFEMIQVLGGIEVSVKQKEWVKIGSLQEIGPIATNVELIEIPDKQKGKVHIRLQCTKGLWRLNYLALASLDEKIEPQYIQPHKVIYEGREDSTAQMLLTNPKTTLVSLPGDEYKLFYCLPEYDVQYEYFLESQGYYLEWIREEWTKEENAKMTRMLLHNPSRYLKKLAPLYKEVELEMDNSFWNSKYVRQ